MVQKWNEQLHSYEPYTLPEGASLYEEDMDKIVSCAACGKQIAFGDGYTSLHIHNRMGMGYAVCESCHDAEIAEQIGRHVKETAHPKEATL